MNLELNFLVIRFRPHKPNRVNVGIVAFSMNAKQRLILSQPVSDYDHVIKREVVVTYVKMRQRSVLSQTVSPFPCRFYRLKVFKRMSMMRKNASLVFTISDFDPLDEIRPKRVERTI